MKRILLIIVALGFCLYSSAQIQITTRKEKLSDFPTKTTKVVLTGDELVDGYMKAAMKNIWVLSPFEFCSRDEFEAHKGNADYYFMCLNPEKQKNESVYNTIMLTIVKGGSGKELKDMFEVTKFPVCAIDSTYHHRLDAFLPAIVNLLQNHVKDCLYNSFNPIKPSPLSKVSTKAIFIAEDDLTEDLQNYVIHNKSKAHLKVTDTANADRMFIEGADALFSYTFAPDHPVPGSVCYKMLFDARTYELYYYETHVITSSKGKGFLKKDINKIAGSR